MMMNWTDDDGHRDPIRVTVPAADQLLTDMAERLQKRLGFSVATLNLDHVVKLRRNAAFKAAYGEHTHITADGRPIVWLSRLAGQKDIKLVPGSELIEPVAALAEQAGVPVGLFGSTDASLLAAADALRAKFPRLNVAFIDAPEMGFDPDGPSAEQAISRIRESGARIVFLALGAPKQEQFAARAQKALGDVGFLSIGAGLDFVSGTQKRAPAWVRDIAAEWLWRMLSNPKRLGGRYAMCIAAMPGLTLRALAARRRGDAA